MGRPVSSGGPGRCPHSYRGRHQQIALSNPKDQVLPAFCGKAGINKTSPDQLQGVRLCRKVCLSKW